MCLGLLGSLLLNASGVNTALEVPLIGGKDPLSAFFNALFFLALILLGTFLLLTLLRSRKISLLNTFYTVLIALLGLFMYQIYIVSLAQLANVYLSEGVIWILSLSLSLLTSFIVKWAKEEYPIFITLTIYGGLIGPVLLITLPFWSVIAVLIAVSAYDIYSVFKGPLRRVVEAIRGKGSGGSLPLIRGALIPFKGISLGLGDIVFYSLLVSVSTIYPQPSITRGILIVFVALVGYYATLKLVEKKGYAPALPLPVMLGLLTYWVLVSMGY